MELWHKHNNRCINANASQRNEPLIKSIAAKIPKQLRTFCATNCELMTFDSSEVKLGQTHRHQNEKCTKLIRCEYACAAKMVANRDQCGENSYVYVVNKSDEKCTTNCYRGPAYRTNGSASGGGSKFKIRQFLNGHSISVLILIVFSLGFIDMVNGKCRPAQFM